MLMMTPPLLRYFWFHSIYSLAASCSLRSAVCSLQSAVCGLQSAVCSLQMSYTGRILVCYIEAIYIYIYIFILIKIIVQCSECKFPERVLLIGVISICKRFSKVSHRCETKPDVRPVPACNFYLLNIYIMTYNSRFVCKTKK